MRGPGFRAGALTAALVACNAINGSGDLTIGAEDRSEAPGRGDAVIAADAIDWKIELPEASPFAVVGRDSGRIEPGAKVDVTLRAKVFGAGTSEADVLVTAGGLSKNVRLRVVGRGATFEATPAIAPLGDVRMQAGGAATVAVGNSGNDPLVLDGFDGQDADFVASWPEQPSVLTVPPGGSAPVTIRLEPGAESAPLGAALTPRITSTTCGTPAPILVSGRRVNLEVTVTPGAFGTIDCGGAVTKDVVITSYAPQAISYTGTLPPGSPFSIVAGAGGALPAATAQSPSSASITVKIDANAPLGDLAATLGVDIQGVAAPSGGLRNVPLTAKVSGAIVTLTPSSILDFQTSLFGSDIRPVTIKNTGNASIGLSWTLTRTNGDPAWQYNGFPLSLAPGAQATGQVRFQPIANCPCAAKITHAVGAGKLCSPPTDMIVQGMRL